METLLKHVAFIMTAFHASKSGCPLLSLLTFDVFQNCLFTSIDLIVLKRLKTHVQWYVLMAGATQYNWSASVQADGRQSRASTLTAK